MAVRNIGNETVLLNLATGTYFGLDDIGSRFLQLLQSDGRLEKAHAVMLQEFDVPAETLESDLLQLCERMCVAGLLQTLP